jgi:hypothetical protein
VPLGEEHATPDYDRLRYDELSYEEAIARVFAILDELIAEHAASQ